MYLVVFVTAARVFYAQDCSLFGQVEADRKITFSKKREIRVFAINRIGYLTTTSIPPFSWVLGITKYLILLEPISQRLQRLLLAIKISDPQRRDDCSITSEKTAVEVRSGIFSRCKNYACVWHLCREINCHTGLRLRPTYSWRAEDR